MIHVTGTRQGPRVLSSAFIVRGQSLKSDAVISCIMWSYAVHLSVPSIFITFLNFWRLSYIYIYIVSCNVTCFDCNVLLCRAAGRWVKRWFREMFQSRCLSGRVSPLPSCPKAALFPYAPCCAILFRTFGSPTHRSSFSPGQLGRISWS